MVQAHSALSPQNGFATTASEGDTPMLASSSTSNGHSNGVGGSNGGSNLASNGSHASTSRAGVTDASKYEGGAAFVPMYPGSEIDRREFVRITLQALTDMGYDHAAASLSQESGFQLETPSVADFRRGVLQGDWDLVGRLISALPIDDSCNLTIVKFVVCQQRFLEALESNETKLALHILRQELAPLNYNQDKLHILSSFMMCAGPEDLRRRADWDGAGGTSRERLLAQLQEYIPSSLMIPQRRMGALLQQAQAYQRTQCLYHVQDSRLSLYRDCDCDPGRFPSMCTHVLTAHTDEVWRLDFSRDGRWLATAGKDKTIVIWDIQNDFIIHKILRGHDDPVSSIAISPDGQTIVSAAESTIKLWDIITGVCKATSLRHDHSVGGLAWAPDGQTFYSGGMDSRLVTWDASGTAKLEKNFGFRIIDLAITPDGSRMLVLGRKSLELSPAAPVNVPGGGQSEANATAAGGANAAKSEKAMLVLSLPEQELQYEVGQPGELTSVRVTNDSRFALISHSPNELLYLDLANGTILQRYAGHDQSHYIVQSCFGGPVQNYVLSGSEDGKVYIWHRDTGKLVHQLPGHSEQPINAVAWNPASSVMFATVSDDRTVRIWGPETSLAA